MKMKIRVVSLVLLLTMVLPCAVPGQDPGMEHAKALLFDKQWRAALEQLDEVLKKSPDLATAIFYRARCLAELGRPREALAEYTRFLKVKGAGTLREEARISIVDLAGSLYAAGEKGYLSVLLQNLGSSDDSVRFYAALRMSYLKDKSVARRAIPELRRVVERETDPDLVDRARIALLRIDPDALRKTGEQPSMEGTMLRIQVINRRTRKASLSIGIPFMLARLALEALPETERKALLAKGYSLDRIIRVLRSSSEIIHLETDEDEVRIWVEKKQ